MSTVYQRDRAASQFEYFTQAVKIRTEVNRLVASEKIVPKKYRLLNGVPTLQTARELVYLCNKADSFYPNSSLNVQERKRYLTLAVAACHQLIQDLQCIMDIGATARVAAFERVSGMVVDEIKYLKGFRKNVRLIGSQSVEDRIAATERELARLREL